ncbi:FAR1-related sequence 5-like protein [Tanacetum coccineum]
MYKKRSHWAKAYFKDVFLAGMTTSGRSESIHSFFDGFVNSKTMLNEFVIQYDKAVEARRAAEEDEDFKTMNSMPVLSSIHPIEAKAGASYTRKMFEAFKKEWVEATNNLTHETLSKNCDEIKYRVGQVNIEKIYWRIVTFRLSNKVDITCSCAKFETHGMLCKHALYVLKKRHVETLPDHYILPRWTMNVRHKVGNGCIGLEDMHNKDEVSALALWNVHANCSKAVEQAKDSLSEIKKFNNLVVKFLEEQVIRKKSKEIVNASQDPCMESSQVDMMPQISVRDPEVPVTTKGRPKEATRIKSSLEAPKKRRCSYCKELGHYQTACKKRR